MFKTRYKVTQVDGLTTVVRRVGKSRSPAIGRFASPWLAQQLEDFERRKPRAKKRRRKGR